MIDFHILRTNPSLQEILNNNYIKRYVNGVKYAIGGHPTVEDMQKKLMEWKKMHECHDLAHSICPLPSYNFFDEVILVNTNRIIEGPDLDFGESLWFIGIWMLITGKPGTKWADYFSKKPIDIFSGFSIRANQFMSGDIFEIICSAINFTSHHHPRPLTFEINFMEPDRLLLRGMITCKKSSCHIVSHA